MVDLTKADIQEMLDKQSERFEGRIQESLDKQSERFEGRIQESLDKQSERFEKRTKEIVTEVVIDAINQVVMPVLDEVLEKEDQILDRLDPLEHRHEAQQVSLDNHDIRIAALEAKA